VNWPSAREEHFRTAISRAYYAAFLAWREFAISSGSDADVLRSRSVRKDPDRMDREARRGDGGLMHGLSEMRKHSDYDIYYRISRWKAERALEGARKALERLPRLFGC